MERKHWHWKQKLIKEANAGNKRAQKILAQRWHPGRYFDGPAHMHDVLAVIRKEQENGATHIGIFGSRLRKKRFGRRTHRPLDSDVDILVIREQEENLVEAGREGTAGSVDVVRLSKDMWDKADRFLPDTDLLRQIMMSVKWLWVKKGYSKVDSVGEWAKRIVF